VRVGAVGMYGLGCKRLQEATAAQGWPPIDDKLVLQVLQDEPH
jgi:hypothetical protein